MRFLGDLLGTLQTSLGIGRATISAASLSANRTHDLPDKSGTVALTDDIDSQIGFSIIYPNGGSAASPANVSINTRYVESNPFPGFNVMCQVELRIGGRWYVPGWYSDNSGGSRAYGVQANYDGTEFVVQTGVTALATHGRFSGGTYAGSDVTTATPCRVKVWKAKGAI